MNGRPDTFRCAAPLVVEVLDLQLAQFVPGQRVIQQRCQHGTVALALHGVGVRRVQQPPRLMIAKGRPLCDARTESSD